MCNRCKCKYQDREFRNVTAKSVCAEKFQLPEKCKAHEAGYVTKDFLQFGPKNRQVGTWELLVQAPPPAGGDRRNVVCFNLGGTMTFCSTFLFTNPAISQRNMFQGTWYVVAEDANTLTGVGIASVYLYNSLGQVVAFQAFKTKYVVTKDLVDPLNDSVVGEVAIQQYNFVFATPGDPTTSIVGQTKAGPLIKVPYTAKRLEVTDQIVDLADLYNECDNCNNCKHC